MGHGTAENPEHRVILSDFWIYATEVTNQQYAICVQQGRCTAPDVTDNPDFGESAAPTRPVVGVTYDQANEYCNFMGAELPTEAQWEKAARGSDGRRYPWGQVEPSCDLANSGDCGKASVDVTEGEDGRSPYDALNMSGNVYEWVADWYDPIYYESSPGGDPPGPATGRARVTRSSGYRSTADQLLAYARSFTSPNDHRPDLGFRCAVAAPAQFAPACELATSIPSEEMAAVEVQCPTISIDVEVTQCRYGGGAVVTFNNENKLDPNASFGGIVGCTLLSGRPGEYPISYACRHASTAVMSTSCTYSGVPSGECPEPYLIDPATVSCKWPGTRSIGIDCPTGEFYDPAANCCRILTGNLADFPVCPVGQAFTELTRATFACLPAETARNGPFVTAPINPPVCGDLCELTAELCSVRNLVFCPTTCSCLAVGRKCPEP